MLDGILDHIYIYSEFLSAGSVQKVTDNIFIYTGRSTLNETCFDLNEVFAAMFYYYGQDSLVRNLDWCLGANLARSETWDYMQAGKAATDECLKVTKSPELTKASFKTMVD